MTGVELVIAIVARESRGGGGRRDRDVAEAQASRCCGPVTNAIVRTASSEMRSSPNARRTQGRSRSQH